VESFGEHLAIQRNVLQEDASFVKEPGPKEVHSQCVLRREGTHETRVRVKDRDPSQPTIDHDKGVPVYSRQDQGRKLARALPFPAIVEQMLPTGTVNPHLMGPGIADHDPTVRKPAGSPNPEKLGFLGAIEGTDHERGFARNRPPAATGWNRTLVQDDSDARRVSNGRGTWRLFIVTAGPEGKDGRGKKNYGRREGEDGRRGRHTLRQS
jgi:hypothetical protein